MFSIIIKHYLYFRDMAKVHVCNVIVLDNPSPFRNRFQFEITFECIEDLCEDLEWRIIYVGSAESEEFDQVLDTVYVGPVPEGRHKFVFEADPPNPEKIPDADLVGVTVVLLTCSYRSAEFIRVGYYVSNEYQVGYISQSFLNSHVWVGYYVSNEYQVGYISQSFLNSHVWFSIMNFLLSKVSILTFLKVTKFKINWDSNTENSENVPPKLNQVNETNQPMDESLKGLHNQNQ
ncbi:histone chaperone asf1a-A [Eurytemora carolleeae]|uniref:histone chaperone asf1a-A n=1 Tax=Eurytemora carolleeae TaxID=1294199 RepID=UPI000C784D02|nr:histone chaperone asf1a-A [Eurytemora carolleeae]|eukprot:XP_023342166.1 histone chaperone asf1a-A-like [Eurytemora affinis]